jgi:peptidoglycan hydrolase-like protein with peptidoglycan-binding domain
MKKFIMTVAIAGFLAIAGSAQAATFVYEGGLIKVGSMGTKVADLQTCMNGLGHSTGVVDGKFGPMTKAGVMSFQASKGVTVDGIIGPVTGSLYTAACAGETTTTLPEGCTSTEGFSTTTGLACSTTVDLPEGCTATSLYSSTTGAKCDGTTTPSTTVTTGETDLTDYQVNDESDADADTKGEEVASFEFDVEDADALLERVDIYVEGTTVANDLWDNIKTISLEVDGNEIASANADDEDDWDEIDTNTFKFRLSGINFKVLEDEDYEVKMVIDTTDEVESGDADEVYDVAFDTRFVDGEGITTYLGDEIDADGDIAGLSASRKASFKIVAAGSTKITLSESDDNYDAKVIVVDEDEKTEKVGVFVFEIEADDDRDLDLDGLKVLLTTDAANIADVVEKAYLYNGSTEIDSVNISGGASTELVDFDLNNMTIDKDSKEEFTVKLDIAKIGDDPANREYAEGTTIKAEFTATDATTIDVEDKDDDDRTMSYSGSAVGNVHELVLNAPAVELKSVSFEVTEDNDAGAGSIADKATAKFVFKVSANDEDVYLDKTVTADTDATPAIGNLTIYVKEDGVISAANVVSMLLEAKDEDIEKTNSFKISSGATEEFTLTVIVNGANKNDKVYVSGLGWAATDVDSTDVVMAGLDDFDTDSLFISDNS